jgi:hypothetical protein
MKPMFSFPKICFFIVIRITVMEGRAASSLNEFLSQFHYTMYLYCVPWNWNLKWYEKDGDEVAYIPVQKEMWNKHGATAFTLREITLCHSRNVEMEKFPVLILLIPSYRLLLQLNFWGWMHKILN